VFILRTSVLNPAPALAPLLAELERIAPGLALELADWDEDDRRYYLNEVIKEDDRVAAAFRRLFAGDVDDAPDELVRQLFREQWGEDLAYFDDPRGASEPVLAFVRKHRLRLFDDLAGRDIHE
jgi:hypothetical protein